MAWRASHRSMLTTARFVRTSTSIPTFFEMIGIPRELYTPIFAMLRIVGWCAHRLEELNFEDRQIIRPASLNVGTERKNKDISKR